MRRAHLISLLCTMLCCLLISPISAQEQLLVSPENTVPMIPSIRVTHTNGNTTVTEFGASDTYQLSLWSYPTAPVTIRHHTSNITTDPKVLVFTPSNWYIPQTVTVYAPHDYKPNATAALGIHYLKEIGSGNNYNYEMGYNVLPVYINDTPKTIPNDPLVVTTLEDSISEEISGSLRQMMHIANARVGVDTITFSSDLAGTLFLKGDLPLLTEKIKIIGNGQDKITIDGNNRLYTAFSGFDSYGRIYVNSGLTDIEIEGLTLSNLWSAVILHQATLTDVSVINSGHGTNAVYGSAAVKTLKKVTLNRVTMIRNSASWGGALASYVVDIHNSTFIDNSALLAKYDSQNPPIALGGAIMIFSQSEPRVYPPSYIGNTTFSGNTSEDKGGAIFINSNTPNYSGVMTVSIVNSTFVGNKAQDGGAIYLHPNQPNIIGNIDSTRINILNSTFSANSATERGAAISGDANVIHTTFSGHHTSHAEGIALIDGGSTLIGSIITHNTAVDSYECGEEVSTIGSLATDPQCLAIAPATGLDVVLRHNMGLTRTHGLLAGGNAQDLNPITGSGQTTCAILSEKLTALGLPLTDQRGITRPYGNTCDLGAFEYAGVITEPNYETILNGSFEVASVHNTKPDSWISRLSIPGDNRLCTTDDATLIAPDGQCVYQFWSSFLPRFNRSLNQGVISNNWGDADDIVVLSASVEGRDFGTGAFISAILTYADGSEDKQMLEIPSGTYAFREISTSISLSGTPISVDLRLVVNKSTGRLLIDSVSLKAIENMPIPFPMIESRPGSTFELPAAPDGFRR